MAGNPYGGQRARRSLIHTVGFRSLSQVATVLGYVVVVRAMSEHDFGILNLLYAFIPALSTFASLGLEQVLRRYQPEYLRSGNATASAWLVRVISGARLASNVLVLAAVLAAWTVVAPIFQLQPYRFEFALFSLLILLHFQMRILQFSLASHMLHRYSVGSLAMLPIAKLVAYLILWWQGTLDLETAIVADTVAYAITYVLLRSAYSRHCRPPKEAATFKPEAGEGRRLLKYGLYNNFNDAGAFIIGSRSDNFFIAALLNAVAVGTYAFYVRLSEMIANVSPGRLFDNVIQPLFFAIPKEEGARRIPRYFTPMLNTNLLLQMAAFAYSVAYHREIVQVLFAGKFIDYSPLLPMVMGFAALNVIAVPVTLVAQHAEKVSIILLGKIFVIYQVVATLALIPIAGLYGAAFATGTSQLAKNLFVWWHVRDQARWLNFPAVLGMSVVIWGGAIVSCLGLKAFVPAHALVHLILGALVCGVASLAYMRSPGIAHSDREVLGTVLKGREAVLLRWLGMLPRQA